MLQSEEEIAPDCRRISKQGPAVVSYNKYHEMCLSLKHSQLILPIPLHITPAFSTDMGKIIIFSINIFYSTYLYSLCTNYCIPAK